MLDIRIMFDIRIFSRSQQIDSPRENYVAGEERLWIRREKLIPPYYRPIHEGLINHNGQNLFVSLIENPQIHGRFGETINSYTEAHIPGYYLGDVIPVPTYILDSYVRVRKIDPKEIPDIIKIVNSRIKSKNIKRPDVIRFDSFTRESDVNRFEHKLEQNVGEF